MRVGPIETAIKKSCSRRQAESSRFGVGRRPAEKMGCCTGVCQIQRRRDCRREVADKQRWIVSTDLES